VNTEALLFMPFADGVRSTVNKAKNIHFVGENHPGMEIPFQVLALLPLLPPPVRKRILNAFYREREKQSPYSYYIYNRLSTKISPFLRKNCFFVPLMPHLLPKIRNGKQSNKCVTNRQDVDSI